MSAWIVSKEHIDALVAAIGDHDKESITAPDELGRLLWKENLASVAYRYPDDGDGQRPGPNGFRDNDVAAYKYTAPSAALHADAQLKLADCYVYQSCEHTGWSHSEAHRIIGSLIESLKKAGADDESQAYDDAPWGL